MEISYLTESISHDIGLRYGTKFVPPTIVCLAIVSMRLPSDDNDQEKPDIMQAGVICSMFRMCAPCSTLMHLILFIIFIKFKIRFAVLLPLYCLE